MRVNDTVSDYLKKHLVFIVIAVSFLVICANYYILDENISKVYEINKERILKQMKLSYVSPLWKLDDKNVKLISEGYIQNNIICAIKVVSLPGHIILFNKKNKKQCKKYDRKKIEIIFNGKKIGYIDVSFSKELYNSQLNNLLITNISLVFLILAIIYFSIDLLLKSKIAKPINDLRIAIKKIEIGDYSDFYLPYDFVEIEAISSSLKRLRSKIKERETLLRQSEEKFRNLAESAPLGILIYQGEKWIYCNRESERITGYSREELLSMKFWSIAAPEHRDMVKKRGLLRQQEIRGLPRRYELNIITKRGEKRLIDFMVTPIKLNERTAGLVIAQDITEQRKTQVEVENLRNLLQNIVNSMPSLLVTVDKDFKIVYWNKFLERAMRDKNVQDIKNRYVFDVLEDDIEFLEKLKKAFISKNVQFYFRKITKEDGKEIYENITISPLENNGIEGAVIKVDDITQQMLFEERLIHSEKMITIGNMAAGIAHEINNPLAIIMQACDICCKRLEDSSKNREVAEAKGINFDNITQYIKDRKIDKMLFNIKDATQRAADIIRGLLSFSAGGYGKKTDVDIRNVMNNAIAMAYGDYNLEKKYDVRKIKFIKQYKDISLIECDPVKMEQVFLNIIKNAAEAMSGMKDPEIRIDISSINDTINIEIKDNGPGIPREIIDKIFDPFYTTKGVGEGVGLGLYISYFIVTKQHGGDIRVHSFPGKGASFTISLPINKKREDLKIGG